MSAVDFCTDSRHGKLDLASVVEMEGEESGGAFSEQPYNLEMKILCQRVFYLSPWHSPHGHTHKCYIASTKTIVLFRETVSL